MADRPILPRPPTAAQQKRPPHELRLRDLLPPSSGRYKGAEPSEPAFTASPVAAPAAVDWGRPTSHDSRRPTTPAPTAITTTERDLMPPWATPDATFEPGEAAVTLSDAGRAAELVGLQALARVKAHGLLLDGGADAATLAASRGALLEILPVARDAIELFERALAASTKRVDPVNVARTARPSNPHFAAVVRELSGVNTTRGAR